jgi:hypothetical protein
MPNSLVLVADYGRSGQGWLSYMLCYILNAQYIEPYDLAKGVKYTKSDHVLALTQGRLPDRPGTRYSLIVKTHNYPAPNFNLTNKVIYLTRDPRDVAVSKYCMHLANLQGTKNKGTQMVLNTGLLRRTLNAILTIKTVQFMITASRWKKHVLGWKPIPALHVTYEDLVRTPEETLLRILAFLEVEVDRALVTKAVAEFAFERITGRKQGQEDPLNPEYRKGISGDYENHFNAFHEKCFKMICGDAAAMFGYKL